MKRTASACRRDGVKDAFRLEKSLPYPFPKKKGDIRRPLLIIAPSPDQGVAVQTDIDFADIVPETETAVME
jgi:hypothetical protein